MDGWAEHSSPVPRRAHKPHDSFVSTIRQAIRAVNRQPALEFLTNTRVEDLDYDRKAFPPLSRTVPRPEPPFPVSTALEATGYDRPGQTRSEAAIETNNRLQLAHAIFGWDYTLWKTADRMKRNLSSPKVFKQVLSQDAPTSLPTYSLDGDFDLCEVYRRLQSYVSSKLAWDAQQTRAKDPFTVPSTAPSSQTSLFMGSPTSKRFLDPDAGQDASPRKVPKTQAGPGISQWNLGSNVLQNTNEHKPQLSEGNPLSSNPIVGNGHYEFRLRDGLTGASNLARRFAPLRSRTDNHRAPRQEQNNALKDKSKESQYELPQIPSEEAKEFGWPKSTTLPGIVPFVEEMVRLWKKHGSSPQWDCHTKAVVEIDARVLSRVGWKSEAPSACFAVKHFKIRPHFANWYMIHTLYKLSDSPKRLHNPRSTATPTSILQEHYDWDPDVESPGPTIEALRMNLHTPGNIPDKNLAEGSADAHKTPHGTKSEHEEDAAKLPEAASTLAKVTEKVKKIDRIFAKKLIKLTALQGQQEHDFTRALARSIKADRNEDIEKLSRGHEVEMAQMWTRDKAYNTFRRVMHQILAQAGADMEVSDFEEEDEMQRCLVTSAATWDDEIVDDS